MICAVLDTNVLISSIISDGPPAEIMRRARSHQFTQILSGYILEETRCVMVSKLGLDATETESLLTRIAGFSQVIPIFGATNAWCDDPADNPIIETAVRAGADFLLTGDKVLLQARAPGVHPVSPAEFLAELDSSATGGTTSS